MKDFIYFFYPIEFNTNDPSDFELIADYTKKATLVNEMLTHFKANCINVCSRILFCCECLDIGSEAAETYLKMNIFSGRRNNLNNKTNIFNIVQTNNDHLNCVMSLLWKNKIIEMKRKYAQCRFLIKERFESPYFN